VTRSHTSDGSSCQSAQHTGPVRRPNALGVRADVFADHVSWFGRTSDAVHRCDALPVGGDAILATALLTTPYDAQRTTMSNAEQRLREMGITLPKPRSLPRGIKVPASFVRVHDKRRLETFPADHVGTGRRRTERSRAAELRHRLQFQPEAAP
jgi:hypothetical protein